MNRNTIIYKILHNCNLFMLKYLRKYQYKKLSEWYITTDYANQIKKFKNIHKGERCFIIGNGPSLTPEDLDLIRNEYSFSCNRIYKILNKTKWRPYYFVADDGGIVSSDYKNIINEINCKAKFIGVEFDKKIINFYINSDVIILKEKTILENKIPKWNLNIEEYICAGHTVTFPMVQLAIYMGFKEIYFIGQDCSYMATLENGRIAKNHFYESNHRLSQADAKSLFYAFEAINNMAKENNVKVFNATRGGKLETFPRVKLEDII